MAQGWGRRLEPVLWQWSDMLKKLHSALCFYPALPAPQVSAAGVVLGESLHQATNFRGGCRLAAEAAVAAWAQHEPQVAAAKAAAQADKAAAGAADGGDEEMVAAA